MVQKEINMAEFGKLDEEDEETVFRGLADLPASPPEMRESCERCKRPMTVCLCAFLPPTAVQVSTTIHVLQHPREECRLLTTVPLLAACLPPDKCHIYRARRFSKNEFANLHDLVLQPNTVILYPGPSAVDIKSLALSENCHLIVPDGTWRQAQDIFKNNAFLHGTARQVLVDHKSVSEYVIRTQPNNKSLCTLEAIALALSAIEKNEKLYEILTSPLRALCQIQLDHGAVSHKSKEERQKELETDSPKETKKKRRRRRRRRTKEEMPNAADEDGSL